MNFSRNPVPSMLDVFKICRERRKRLRHREIALPTLGTTAWQLLPEKEGEVWMPLNDRLNWLAWENGKYTSCAWSSRYSYANALPRRQSRLPATSLVQLCTVGYSGSLHPPVMYHRNIAVWPPLLIDPTHFLPNLGLSTPYHLAPK